MKLADYQYIQIQPPGKGAHKYWSTHTKMEDDGTREGFLLVPDELQQRKSKEIVSELFSRRISSKIQPGNVLLIAFASSTEDTHLAGSSVMNL